jgi:hypothetical protein
LIFDMQPVPQDTPVHRATIKELTPKPLDELVESMRVRRMHAQKAYEIAQEAKAKLKLEKDKARYDKLLDMLGKNIEGIDKGLVKAGKYINELKVLQILGE